jgi:hypothetical protein
VIVALSGFWQDVAANVVAGAVILLAGAFVIERILERRDRKEERQKRKEAALKSVLAELEYNQGQLEDLRTSIAESQAETVNVLFLVHGWDLIRQESVLTTLQGETIEGLFAAYRTFHVVNDVHKLVFDHFHGATATLIEFDAILRGRLPQARHEYEKHKLWYLRQVKTVLDALEPEEILDDAITQVRVELREEPGFWKRLSTKLRGREESHE